MTVVNTDKPTLDQVITYLTHRLDGMTMPGAVRMTTAAMDYLVELQAENEKLRAELEQERQGRDDGVLCIRGIAECARVWMCRYCVQAKVTTVGIAECELDVGVCMMSYSKFVWRGTHKEE